MSVTAARDFRQHVNRMSTLQAEIAQYFSNGAIDYAGMAELGRRSGFDFTAEEAKRILFAAADEMSNFEREMMSALRTSAD
ncbi:hypothetical protein [Massilia sp. METH4]|uniref:hypothetical protein n=1 Tax=Massilia sp. METH4 TaxID=3123041 RepID=UPI0030CA609F